MSSISGVSGLESSLYTSLIKAKDEDESIIDALNEDDDDDDSLVINNDDDKSIAEQSGAAVATTEVTTTSASGIANMQDQIDTAVSEALQNLDKSSGAAEVMSTIRNAVDSTLRANGVDPAEMKGQMQPPPGAESGQAPEDGGLGAKIDELLTENGFDAEAIKAELAAQGPRPEDDSTTGFVNVLAAQEGVDSLA